MPTSRAASLRQTAFDLVQRPAEAISKHRLGPRHQAVEQAIRLRGKTAAPTSRVAIRKMLVLRGQGKTVRAISGAMS